MSILWAIATSIDQRLIECHNTFEIKMHVSKLAQEVDRQIIQVQDSGKFFYPGKFEVLWKRDMSLYELIHIQTTRTM